MRECDVVMKGGITSGVVYPMAVYELAKTYRFRNIGGTSAGAIAAALTAAAEYRRQTQSGVAAGEGFEELKALPTWLQQKGNLKNLFQPGATTHPIFTLILSLALSQQASWASRIVTSVFASMYRIAAIVPLVIMLLVLWRLCSVHLDWPTRALCILLDIVCGIAIFTAAPLGWALRDLFTTVPNNRYGMCSGMPGPNSDLPALTPWLADKIDAIAGKLPEEPLTFGDLWNADDMMATSGERNINIEMVTTNVTYGRPFTLPFEADSALFFKRTDMEALFPDRIVTWMADHPRPCSGNDTQALRDGLSAGNIFAMPTAQDIPIVVCARLSLSFPLLLSAVPLYMLDEASLRGSTGAAVRCCWFSDGGLSSNFPIQFFDAPIPCRPTFGINLCAFDDVRTESANQSDNVWMPLYNDDRIGSSRNGFDDKGPNLLGFLSSIIDTMQNWNDTLQAQVPGFRDRIVHVFLSPSEGGLNLDMPQSVLDKLSERGKRAGELLAQRFTSPSPAAPPQTVNWENHRWVRFRTAGAMLQRFIVDFSKRYTAAPNLGEPSYPALIARPPETAPFSYALSQPAQQRFVSAETAELTRNGVAWSTAAPNDFATGSPTPEPELQVRPRI